MSRRQSNSHPAPRNKSPSPPPSTFAARSPQRPVTMTALAPSALSSSLAGPSSGPSSPASPTANFNSAQQSTLTAARSHSHLRSASRPGTPTMLNVTTNTNLSSSVNGSNSSNSAAGGGPSLEPPHGVSYADFIASWGDAHVARWLAALDPHGKCAAHAGAFRAADVRGSVLLDLDQPSLKEIGVTSIGDRIRILNAVKALRIKCSNRRQQQQVIGHGHGAGSSVSSVASNSSASANMTTANVLASHSSPKLTVTNSDSTDALTRPQHHRNRSRPAPLQLRSPSQAQNDLPRLIRDNGPMPDSARSTTPMRSLPQPSSNQSQSQVNTPQVSSHSHSSSSSGSGSNLVRQHLPPLPPPPRTQPPLPPTQGSRGQPARFQSSGRRTPTQAEAPPLPHYAPPPVPTQQNQGQTQNQSQSATAQTPTQSQNPVLLTPSSSGSAGGWKGEYGLPSGPRPGQGASSRATSPLPGLPGRRSPGGASTHTKAPSYSVSTGSSSVKTAPRPNTSGGHPYAATSSNSSLQPPAPPPQSGGTGGLSLALSPIAESFIGQGSGLPTPVPPTAGSSASASSMNLGSGGSSNPNASAYHVGRGLRPATPAGGQGGTASGAPSLDDLRRRLVRFRLAEDGHSAMISVAECSDGVEVFERVLRKFGKLGTGATGAVDPDSDEGGLSIDGWAVYLDWGEDEGPRKYFKFNFPSSLCVRNIILTSALYS